MLNTYPLAKDLQVLVEIVHSGAGPNARICDETHSDP